MEMQTQATSPARQIHAITHSRRRIDVSKFEETYRSTLNIERSAIAAGYSAESAKRGKASLSAACKEIITRVDKGLPNPEEADAKAVQEYKEQVANIKGPEDMVRFLLGVCGDYIVGRKAVPKGLDSVMKLAGNLKGFNSFSSGERGEGVFVIQAPDSSVFDRLDESLASELPDTLELTRLSGCEYSDTEGNRLRVKVVKFGWQCEMNEEISIEDAPSGAF